MLSESSFLPSIVADFRTNRAKRGKNKFLFGGRWCFLGIFGDNKGRNLNIFLKSRKEGGVLRWSAACLLACPLVQAFEAQDLPEVGSGPLVVCSLLLVAFSLCSRCVACKYGSISHSKGVFRGFPLLDVCLYCSGALRGLWGFCTRVELGGLKACGVFAFLFILFAFRFILLPCFWGFAIVAPWLVLLSCLSCFVFVVGVAFSLTDYTQKERAQVLCVLSCPVVCCWSDILKHYRNFLRFIVAISHSFASDSCHLFRLFHWVVYYLPVFVNS